MPKESSQNAAMTQEASLAFVKNIISISVGCVSFLRALFPLEAFSDKLYFVPAGDGESPLTEKQRKNQSLRIKTLKKGVLEEVDTLLSWLSEDVYQLIITKSLVCLCMEITKGKKVLESYNFDIGYPEKTRNGSDKLLFYRKEAQRLLKTLILKTQSLDPLPRYRSVKLKLIVSSINGTNEDLKLRHFKRSKQQGTAAIPNSNATHASGRNKCGVFGTQFHRAAISISVDAESSLSSYNIETMLTKPRISLTRKRILPEASDAAEPAEKLPKVEHAYQEKTNSELHGTDSLDLGSKISTEQKNIVEKTTWSTKDYSKSCDCGAVFISKTTDEVLIGCTKCSRDCHALCYFPNGQNKQKKKFECLSCKMAKNSSVNVPEVVSQNGVEVGLNVRKAYNLLDSYGTSKRKIPSKLSLFFERLGISCEGEKNRELLSKTLGVLFAERIFLFGRYNDTSGSNTQLVSNDILDHVAFYGFYLVTAKKSTKKNLKLNDTWPVTNTLGLRNATKHRATLQTYLFDDKSESAGLFERKRASTLYDNNLQYLKVLARAHSPTSSFQATQNLPSTQMQRDTSAILGTSPETSFSYPLSSITEDNTTINPYPEDALPKSYLFN